MMEDLKTRIRKLDGTIRFILRIAYPITIYLIFHLVFVYAFGFQVNVIQLIFIGIWAFLEWKLFLNNK